MSGGDRLASLEEVLAERERRAERRGALALEYGKPVVQLTICAPGPRKDGADIREAARIGAALFERTAAEAAFPILFAESDEGAAGPCFLWVVDADAALVKRVAVGLEDGYSLGRLWDFDVHGAGGLKLDREAVGSAARKCFVCGSPAAVCAGRRLHEPTLIETRFLELLTQGINDLE